MGGGRDHGDGVDREIMRRTLHKTMKEWKWDQTWGWDYPMMAMTAALGRMEEFKLHASAQARTGVTDAEMNVRCLRRTPRQVGRRPAHEPRS